MLSEEEPMVTAVKALGAVPTASECTIKYTLTNSAFFLEVKTQFFTGDRIQNKPKFIYKELCSKGDACTFLYP